MSGGLAAASQIVGGIIGRDAEKDAIRDQNRYNSPEKVRERAEKAGFNPLLFVGPGVGQQVATGSNIMGSSIASAGLALADGMDKAKMLEIERSRLAMDREKLDALIQNATIRPKSGGIYAGNVSAPSAGGVGSAGNVSQGVRRAAVAGSDSVSAAGDIPVPDPLLNRGSGIYAGGEFWKAADGWSPASVWENEYGEVGGAVYGIGKMGVDLYANIKPGDGFNSPGDQQPVVRRPAPKAAPGQGRVIGKGVGYVHTSNHKPAAYPYMPQQYDQYGHLIGNRVPGVGRLVR